MNILYLIPARGGSKRIPKKNIREFLGHPMISYSIRAAQDSKLFDRIIVSTDSQEIADIAKRYGAEVPFMRPASLSNDFAGTNEVIYHALQFFRDKGKAPKFACCLYATAPFTQPEYLRKGFEVLDSSLSNNAFSVTTFPFPLFRAQRINKDGLLEMQWPEHRLTRSQDLPEFYHDAGQFYWTKVDRFLESPDLYLNAHPVILPRYLVQDIDTEEDWMRAELMYKALFA